jgi:secondary thiamine-phosphate synthase enzyme
MASPPQTNGTLSASKWRRPQRTLSASLVSQASPPKLVGETWYFSALAATLQCQWIILRERTENSIMKTLTEYLSFHTKTHRAYVHITPQVEEILRKSGVKEGMVLVSAMHITAGVYVNDNESGLIEDIDQWLEHLAPFRKDYKHHNTGEDNGDSHLKALLIHHEVIVPITGGKLDLGTWQRIFYAEFDGQRDKRVIVKVMGE